MDTSVRAASANATAQASPTGAAIAPKSYATSGKIMLSTIASLLAVVVLLLCLHIYSRWYFFRLARRRRLARALARRDAAAAGSGSGRGLDPELVKSLPVFTYSPPPPSVSDDVKEQVKAVDPPPRPECAVCLCEFEERDQGRLLPACGHAFHADCISMWFQAHSTCPLCRALVERAASKPEPDKACCCGAQEGGKAGETGPSASTSSSGPGSPGSSSNSSMTRCLPNLDFRIITREGVSTASLDLERGEAAMTEQCLSAANSARSKTRSST